MLPPLQQAVTAVEKPGQARPGHPGAGQDGKRGWPSSASRAMGYSWAGPPFPGLRRGLQSRARLRPPPSASTGPTGLWLHPEPARLGSCMLTGATTMAPPTEVALLPEEGLCPGDASPARQPLQAQGPAGLLGPRPASPAVAEARASLPCRPLFRCRCLWAALGVWVTSAPCRTRCAASQGPQPSSGPPAFLACWHWMEQFCPRLASGETAHPPGQVCSRERERRPKGAGKKTVPGRGTVTAHGTETPSHPEHAAARQRGSGEGGGCSAVRHFLPSKRASGSQMETLEVPAWHPGTRAWLPSAETSGHRAGPATAQQARKKRVAVGTHRPHAQPM